MINFFIKFDDLKLSSLKLFYYKEGAESLVETKNLVNVRDSFIPGSSLFVMLPSALFGFYSTDNDLGLKDEILKEISSTDKITNEVYKSYVSFKEDVEPWTDISDKSYLDIR